ncbi:MAG: hypothetical protein HYV63_17810 [Candidatus Schekmanbacteria bacterium]|nr:hypothetical protein [Candidatus Schekmanbacteria bacterium]
MKTIAFRERSFGELIELSVSLPLAHFGRLFFILVVLGIPLLVCEILFAAAADNMAREVDPEQGLIQILVAIVLLLVTGFLIWPLQQAAAILVVAGSYTGELPSLGECLRLAARKLLPVLALSTALGLILIGGALLLVFPAFIALCTYYVAVPALVLENLTWTQAFGRSAELTKGERWPIFWFVLLIILMTAVVSGAGQVPAAIATLLLGAHGTPAVQYGLLSVQFLIQTVAGMLGTVAPLIYYFNLRAKREALDIAGIAELVDAIGERWRGTSF